MYALQRLWRSHPAIISLNLQIIDPLHSAQFRLGGRQSNRICKSHAKRFIEYNTFESIDSGFEYVCARGSAKRDRNLVIDDMYRNFVLGACQGKADILVSGQ